MLVQKAESLHAFAPFTLNRAAIEGGAVAVWLLTPKTRDERIRRRLILATQNAFDAAGVLRTMGKASSLTDRLNDVRKVAGKRPALDPGLIVSRPPGIGRIIGEAGVASSSARRRHWQRGRHVAVSPTVVSGRLSPCWIARSLTALPTSSTSGSQPRSAMCYQ
jgi:hypothetical protein